MDPRILDVYDKKRPRFNPEVCDGFHKREFDKVEKYYESLLHMILEPLSSKGVHFIGLKLMRPEEMFEAISSSNQHKCFEINKESLYPYRLLFEVEDSRGNRIPIDNHYQMLPYTDKYGDVWIRGTRYSLQIVMADRGLSVTNDEQILVRILGYRVKIGSENLDFVRVYNDGPSPIKRPVNINLSANRFYSATKQFAIKDAKIPEPLLAWYMFAVYGFNKTMTDFAECEYQIANTDYLVEICKATDGWQIYTNSGKLNAKLIGDYLDTGLSVAVRTIDPKRRKEEIPTIALQYVGALIFLFDVVPTLVDLDRLDDVDFWKLIIGKCSMCNKNGDASILKQMYNHFDSLSESLDSSSIKRFAAQNIMVKDKFELFNHIIGTRTEFVKTFDRAQMFNKELCSLEYTLEGLTSAATRFKHEIKNTTDLTIKKVKDYAGKHFKTRSIEKAAWETNLVQEATPTDCPLVDYVLGVVPQTKFSNLSKKKSSDFNPNDTANVIHASLPFVMSAERITKPAPDGRGYLNPSVYLKNGKITALPDHLRKLYLLTNDRLTKLDIKKVKNEHYKPELSDTGIVEGGDNT